LVVVDVVEVGVVEVDVVVVDVMEVVDEDYLMNDLVHFGMYNRLDLNIDLEGQSSDFLDHTIHSQCKHPEPPFYSAHPCGKALRFIVVSCHRQKVAEALIPFDADKKANNVG